MKELLRLTDEEAAYIELKLALSRRAQVLVTGRFGTGSYRCSGVLINKDTVVTAGHCVHGTNPKVWATSVVVRDAMAR